MNNRSYRENKNHGEIFFLIPKTEGHGVFRMEKKKGNFRTSQIENTQSFQRKEIGHTKTKNRDVRGLLKNSIEIRRQWSDDFRTFK